jgi:hypothetical protein
MLRLVMSPFGTRPRRVIALGALVAIALGSSSAFAEELTGLAQRLAEMRGQVESLSDQLNARKTDVQEELRSLSRQKAELELEVQREDTRLDKLRQAVAQKRAEVANETKANAALAPAFSKNIGVVRAYVEKSLPFRVKERLSELDKIEDQAKSGLLPPQRALNRLWGFVEDELRMTRESGLFSQPVTVEGKEQLADVVRVGMVALYYKTPSDEFGMSAFENGSWTFRSLNDAEQRKQLRTLFETFKKQIRVGYFELPNALPAAR